MADVYRALAYYHERPPEMGRGEAARVTPEPGDTPVMRYLFVRVPLAEYGGERLEANLNRNERLLELIYYPQESSDG